MCIFAGYFVVVVVVWVFPVSVGTGVGDHLLKLVLFELLRSLFSFLSL